MPLLHQEVYTRFTFTPPHLSKRERASGAISSSKVTRPVCRLPLAAFQTVDQKHLAVETGCGSVVRPCPRNSLWWANCYGALLHQNEGSQPTRLTESLELSVADPKVLHRGSKSRRRSITPTKPRGFGRTRGPFHGLVGNTQESGSENATAMASSEHVSPHDACKGQRL